MNTIKIILYSLALLICIGINIYFIKTNYDIKQFLNSQNEELMKADLELGRAKTELVNQKKLHIIAVNEIDIRLQKEIKARQALITMYTKIQALYEAEKKNIKTITQIIYKDRLLETQVDLPKGKLYVRLEDNSYKNITAIPWKYDDFRISISGDALKSTLSYSLHQRFFGQLIETRLPTGAYNHYVKLYEVDDKDQKVNELKLISFTTLKANDLSSTFSWFNPKLDFSIGIGLNTVLEAVWTGEIGISLSSYGITKDDIVWRFFRFGFGVVINNPSISFSPAQLNVGKFLPLISNLWLAPYIGYDLSILRIHSGLMISLVF